jgi:lauroyl/myristoyl acyltransferase
MVMQRIMSWLEGIIRTYPDQWFMFRQMWPGSEQPRRALSPRLSSLDC